MPDSRVIVLDNGHGGKNEGLNYRGFIEKDMNLIVANAMKETLMQYDDVEVYITNPEKKDMSLKQRAEYAKSVGADAIICLHFNMSEEHNMYGSEVWIPSKGLPNAKMHALGDIFIDQFAEKGLTVRGVKTRLNDAGNDYYGIIRESEELGIPCVLVEHAYADHDMDASFIATKQDLEAFGILDAQAVAKYYHMKSATLGTDYTGFVKNGYHAPEAAIGSDMTEPAEATLIWLMQEGEYTREDEQTFLIGATEEESSLVYYDYSLDGGQTWSLLYPFERDKTQMEIKIQNVTPDSQVVARIYNGHYLYATTNTISFQPQEDETEQIEDNEGYGNVSQELTDFYPLQKDVEEQLANIQQNSEKSDIKLQNGKITPYLFSGFGIFLAIMLFLAAFFTKRFGNRKKTLKRERMLFITAVCVLLLSVTSLGMLRIKSDTEVASIAESGAENDDAQKEINSEGYINETAVSPTEDELLINEEELEEENRFQSPYQLSLLSLNGEKEKLPEKLSYQLAEEETAIVYDIAEGYLRVPLLDSVPRNVYDLSAFSGENLSLQYTGSQTMRGIDVSKFQGDIDFAAVKEAGIEFVIIRLGLRGYGSGKLTMDEKFYTNLSKAQEAGLKTGIYFFSAAIDEEEAREEANYVLNAIAGYTMEMPIVFDTEPILHDVARTDNLSPNQLTRITKAFCETIQAAGYQPMIYANAKRFTTVLHLEELAQYDLWLADYRQAPDFPYAFKMWQYTEHGNVPGIGAEVDIDLYFY